MHLTERHADFLPWSPFSGFDAFRGFCNVIKKQKAEGAFLASRVIVHLQPIFQTRKLSCRICISNVSAMQVVSSETNSLSSELKLLIILQSMLHVVVDCKFSVTPSTKRWILFPLPSNLGWLCDYLIKYGRSDAVPVSCSRSQQTGSFHFSFL